MTVAESDGQEYGLFLQESEHVPPAVPNLLRLLLNYRFGLETLTAGSIKEALPISAQHGAAIRIIFLLRHDLADNRNQLLALSRHGQVSLFVVVPKIHVVAQKQISRALKNVFTCAWEDATGGGGPSLQQIVSAVCDQQGIGAIDITDAHVPRAELDQRVLRRLKHVGTLPTVPSLVLHITRLLHEPSTTIDDLEQLLVSDPAIVHRLLRVVGSAALAGTRANGEWTLRQAVVRLGLEQIGSIALQIKLMNSLVRPDKSKFDIRRFWEHSVAVAVLADRLHRKEILPLHEPVPIDHYWIGALMHDIGKLVMGFFYWDAFQAVIKRMNTPRTPFHWAEARLGNPVTHEHIAQLVLARAKADPKVIQAVGSHNSVRHKPSPLVCLLNVSDNFAKAVGLGYLAREEPVYSPPVLDALGMSEEQMLELQASAAQSLADEVAEVVNHCLG